MSNGDEKKDSGEVKGFLKRVEQIGNALPHPIIIFILLALAVILISGIVAAKGLSVTFLDANTGADKTVKAVSLLNADGLRYMFNNAVDNFVSFGALGTVLVVMLGVGLAEWSGLIETSLKKLLTGVNPRLLTAIVVFAGIMSNVAADAGYIVVIPLGALMFAGAGRHPIAGLAAAFAGVSGGFSANLIIGSVDTLVVGITNEALQSTGSNYLVTPTSNWYFLIVSTFLLTFLGVIVTEKIVEKNLGTYTGDFKPTQEPISEKENKGLRNAGIVLLIIFVVFAFLMIPKNALFKTLNPETGQLTLDEFLNSGLLVFILIAFLFPALAYGKTTGKIKDSNDFAAGITHGMKSMAGLLALIFFVSQFVDYFNYTNLGTILSVNGAELLKSINLTGLPLVISFILVTALLNLFMGGAVTKWAIMAPMFLPMMMELGLTPELTQVAYRIGDSATNIITPLMSFFPMIVVFAQRYDKESGIGTLISTMIPYSIVFLLGWIVLMIIWFMLNLPLGPGAPLHLASLLFG